MYLYSTLGAPEDVNLDAWATYLRSIRDSLNDSWNNAKRAYFTLKEIREQFGLPFIVDPIVTEGGTVQTPGAWTTDLQNSMLKLEAIVDILNVAATDVLEDRRQFAWNAQIQDFQIEKLATDPVTVQIINNEPELVDSNGAVIPASSLTGDLRPVGVGFPPIAVVAIVAVATVGVYFTVEAICDAVEKSAEQKTMQTLGEKTAELVAQDKATPEQAAAMTSAVYKGAAEVKKAEALAQGAKPPNELGKTLRTLGWVALGIGGIYLASTVIRRAPARSSTLALAR